MPNVCICAETGVACWIVVNHWRPRKTGPMFPLAVVRCVVHGVAFTLYPRGHVPYGQIAVAPVSPDGSAIATEAGDRWTRTIFGASADASRAVEWARATPRDNEDRLGKPPDRWASTQRRRLTAALAILGVAVEQPERQREQHAEALGVDLIDVLSAAKAVRDDAGYVARGREVVRLLDQIAHALLRRLPRRSGGTSTPTRSRRRTAQRFDPRL